MSRSSVSTPVTKSYLCHFPPDVHEWLQDKAAEQTALAGGKVTVNEIIIDRMRQNIERETEEAPETENGHKPKGRSPKKRK